MLLQAVGLQGSYMAHPRPTQHPGQSPQPLAKLTLPQMVPAFPHCAPRPLLRLPPGLTWEPHMDTQGIGAPVPPLTRQAQPTHG